MTGGRVAETPVASPRPVGHFAPHRNWINDPNGLIFHGGLWHAYYQYNPYGIDWGNMSWGHATSADLLTWTEHGVAIEGDADTGIYSGCVVFDAHGSSGLAEVPPLVAIYTEARLGRQAQAVAWSVDGGYSWTKHGVVLDRGSAEFRDPKVFRHAERWILAAVEAKRREVHLFSSANLLDWEPLSVFGPEGSTEGIWECPDLFELDGRWVMTVSTNPGGVAGGSGMQYFVGDFDGRQFTAERHGWVDRGPDFYAGVTFADAPDGESVMLAWMSNWAYADTVPTWPWRGSFALPRRLSLSDQGGLKLRVRLDPLRRLRAEDATALARGEVLRVAGLVRIRLRGKGRDQPFVLALQRPAPGAPAARVILHGDLLTIDRADPGAALFDPSFSARSTSRVSFSGSWDLEVWLDNGSVEVFADDGTISLTHLLVGEAVDRVQILEGAGLVEHVEVATVVPAGG